MTERFGWFIEERSCVVRQAALVYVPTPKAGYTSMLWALSRLAGTLHEHPTDDLYDSPELGIHYRNVHGIPCLRHLADEERSTALYDPGWSRVCVTRSPYDRLVSAWVDRIVVSGTLGVTLHDLGLDPRERSSADLGESFREFVRLLPSLPVVMGDEHFTSQTALLEPGRFPYTHQVDLSELSALVESLRVSSPQRSTLSLGRRFNAGLSVDSRALYDDETACAVAQLYADDLQTYGYPELRIDESPRPVMLDLHHLQLLAMLRARHERQRDLRELVLSRKGGRNSLRELNSAARARLRHSSLPNPWRRRRGR